MCSGGMRLVYHLLGCICGYTFWYGQMRQKSMKGLPLIRTYVDLWRFECKLVALFSQFNLEVVIGQVLSFLFPT